MKVPSAEDIIFDDMGNDVDDCDDDGDGGRRYGERIAQLIDSIGPKGSDVTAIAKCGERYYAVSYFNATRGGIDWSTVSEVFEVVPFNGDYRRKVTAEAA